MTTVEDGSDDRTIVKQLWPDSRPSWSDVTSAGIFRVEPDGRFDRHFHDCDEYWLLFRGRARISVGSQIHEVEAGNIVCTQAGLEHDILAVDGVLEGFWFEARTPPGGRIGHLHRTEEDAQGHVVPAMPGEELPA
jgi:mannose-6-phosphate isomerase-like protein (cupin superfamily)